MSATVSIATPLGALSAVVHVDGTPSRDPSRQSTLPTGARVLVWPDVGGLVIDALVTRVAPFPAASLDLPETQMWGVEWRLHAVKETADITASALLPQGVVPGCIGGDENLVTAEFVTPEWVLAIGGPDEDSLARLVAEGREPASWNDVRMPSEDASAGTGLIWHLPALSGGDAARLHVAVAWCRAGHPRSEDAPWLAVDTSPSAIRTAAGVVTLAEPRREARGT